MAGVRVQRGTNACKKEELFSADNVMSVGRVRDRPRFPRATL
jgi:hypothetical protein